MTARVVIVPSRRTVLMLWACLIGSVAFLLPADPPARAAENGGNPNQGKGGSKGGPGKTAPNPSIVYMSSGSYAPDKPAIRGVAFTITGDTVSSTDTQLAKALAGRDRASIVWSPDGSRYAWIEGQTPETRKILWASPGKPPAVLYQPNDANDPYVGAGTDVLAWGGACSGGGSLLVFAREAKWDDTLVQEIEQPAIMGIDIEPATPPTAPPPDHGQPRLILDASGASGFALSPAGHHLAFDVGYGTNERVSIVPLCESTPAPATLLAWEDFGAARYPYACSDNTGSDCPCNGDLAKVCYNYPSPSVHSIDWSGDGSRLALSVTVGTDPGYPWRDLRVAYLVWNGSSFAKDRVEQIMLDPFFGPASSEHWPQWGPAGPDDDCERLAFSQSAGASDGSTMNGRRLYLHDLVTTNSACFDGPREISARDPRAIDWK